jgi:dTDP-4-dehydrorhamnose reductase
VLRLAREKGKISMIFDQVGTPTYAYDLAKAVLDMLPAVRRKRKEIYHYANEGVASWYDFSRAVCEMAGVACVIQPIETKEYPTPARRPQYSVLNKSKIKKDFSLDIPYWRDSLKICIGKMKGK